MRQQKLRDLEKVDPSQVGGDEKTVEEFIDRRKLLTDLEALRQGWAVADRVLDLAIDIVKAQPAGKVKTPTFLDWRSVKTETAKKHRNDAMIAMYDFIEHTTSGLLEED